MYKFGKRSLGKTVGVNPILSFLAIEAIKISDVDFGLFEGVRTVERQRLLVKRGRSKTMRSYHLSGNAVDLIPYIDGKYTWEVNSAFEEINRCMNIVIEKHGLLGIVEWGGNWKSFVDKPHYQIKRSKQGGFDVRNFKK